MSAAERVRVAAVQYHLRRIGSFDDFADQVSAYAATAAEFDAEVALFPELFTTQLLSIPGADGRPPPFRAIGDYTERYVALFTGLATRHRMHVIGGTHVVAIGNRLENTAHVFAPDGSVGTQPKLHLTPTEVTPWGISPGGALRLFDFPFGRAAVLVCYDIEFPELARMARARGADVIFCPSCTDDRHGHHRVRYSCHARAVEDQVYVVTAPTVGGLPNVEYMRANVGQAAILTPNDVRFPPAGVLAEGEMNQDMVVVGELDLATLRRAREHGAVRTWQDRRGDLYPLIG